MSDGKTRKLETILERVAPGSSARSFQLWACRGEGRGCSRNKFRAQKKHCDDCVLGRDEETLEQLMARLDRGDA